MARELFAGGELEFFETISGVATVSTSSGAYDPAWSMCAIDASAGEYRARFVDGEKTPTQVAANSKVSLHFRVNIGNNGYDQILPGIVDINGKPILRVGKVWPSSYVRVLANTSTNATPVWAGVGTGIGASAINGNYDLIYDTATKEVSFFKDEALVETVTISGTWAAPAYVQLFKSHDFGGTRISEVIVWEDASTVGARLKTFKANAAGSVNTMNGSYTDVAKTAINDTAALISDAAGEEALFNCNDITLPEGYQLGGFWVATRARNDGTSPNDLSAQISVSGTPFESSALGLMPGFTNSLRVWRQNPLTSSPWTAAAINGLQLGAKSKDS